MAFEQMAIEGAQETSSLVELVDDDALSAIATPATSVQVAAYRTGMWSLFVQAIPETGQEIHMMIQSTSHADMTPWYYEDDGDVADHDKVVHVFKQATLTGEFLELGPFYGAVYGIRVLYGYNGGDGTGASLKVYIRGRAQG